MTNARRAVTKAALSIWSLAVLVAACGGGAGESGGAQSPSGGKSALVNNPAPPFSGETVNGKGKVSLDQWKGKVVLVDFWATWCKPCEKSFPKLEELRVKYGASGLEMVAISEDDEDPGIAGIKQFAEKHGAKFPIVWDKDKSIAGKYNPGTMPTSFVVDKKGVVRHAHVGYHDGEEKEIEQEVKSLL